MNPKLQAIKASGLYDADELAISMAPPASADQPAPLYGMQPPADDTQAQDRSAREMEILGLKHTISQLPANVRDALMDKLNREESMAGPGQLPNAQALGVIAQEAGQEQAKTPKAEEETAKDQLIAIATGMLILGGMHELPHLTPKLSHAHPLLQQEYQLLANHNVARSGKLADPYNLGDMQVPAGLPAISRQIQMVRNTGFVRDITENK